jgi:hypothetical protein
MALLPIGGSLQVQNNLREIYVNGSQTTALGYLGAAAMNGSPVEAFSVATAASGSQAPQTSQVQNNSFNYTTTVTAASGASGMMYTAMYYPAITEYVDGMILAFRSPSLNSGASTFNAGAGSYPIYGIGYEPLQGGELNNTASIELEYNSYHNAWIIIGGGYNLQVGTAYGSYQAPQWGQVVLGNNAEYVNYTTTRAFNTTYTNTYGKPIAVSVWGYSTAAAAITAVVNGVSVAVCTLQETPGQIIGSYFLVPIGANYEAYLAGTTTLVGWFEIH